jgi:hypothetical protein
MARLKQLTNSNYLAAPLSEVTPPPIQLPLFDPNLVDSGQGYYTKDLIGNLHPWETSYPGKRGGSPSQLSLIAGLLDSVDSNVFFQALETGANYDLNVLIEAAQHKTEVGWLIEYVQTAFRTLEEANAFWDDAVRIVLPPNRWLDSYHAIRELKQFLTAKFEDLGFFKRQNLVAESKVLPLIEVVAVSMLNVIQNCFFALQGTHGHFEQDLIGIALEPELLSKQQLQTHMPTTQSEIVDFIWTNLDAAKINSNTTYDKRLATAEMIMETWMQSQEFYGGMLLPASAVKCIHEHIQLKGYLSLIADRWRRGYINPDTRKILTSPDYFRLYEVAGQFNFQIPGNENLEDQMFRSMQLNMRLDLLAIPMHRGRPERAANYPFEIVALDYKNSIHPDYLQVLLYSNAADRIRQRAEHSIEELDKVGIPLREGFETFNMYMFGRHTSGKIKPLVPRRCGFFYSAMTEQNDLYIDPDQVNWTKELMMLQRIGNLLATNADLVRRVVTSHSQSGYVAPRPKMIDENVWFELEKGLFES